MKKIIFDKWNHMLNRAPNNPIHLKNKSLLPSLVNLGITAELCSHCIFRPDEMYIAFSSWKIQANYWCHYCIYLIMGCAENHKFTKYSGHSFNHLCQFFFSPRRLPEDKSDPEAWINDESLEIWLNLSLNSSIMQWLFNKKRNTPDVTVLETLSDVHLILKVQICLFIGN